jgi:acetyl-CoA carboxylase carboxyltransferase component
MTIKYRPGPGGARSTLNITAPTVVKASQGLVFRVSVITAPTVAGGIYDAATTAEAATSNQMAVIGTTSTVINLGGAQFYNGLVINPGTSGVVAVFWE